MRKQKYIHKKRIEKNRKNVVRIYLIQLLIAGALLASTVIWYKISGNNLTGVVVLAEDKSYNQSLNLAADANTEYVWIPENKGRLTQIKVSGFLTDRADAKILLRVNDTEYVIFDSSNLNVRENVITGFTTINEKENEEENKSISATLFYEQNSEFDADNDGIESVNGIVDISQSINTNWDIRYDSLCTKWEIRNLETLQSEIICNGNSDCCNLFSLQSERQLWNETLFLSYGKYGSGKLNLISAQVIYANLSSDIFTALSEIVYSDRANLSAVFTLGEIVFENSCVDTCALAVPESDSYLLIINVTNGTLHLDNLQYSVQANKENQRPVLVKNISDIVMQKNSNYSIDLQDYFYDSDGNALFYSVYEMDDIQTAINEGVLAFIPKKDFSGTRFAYVTANDSEKFAVSNVFMINISEIEPEIRARNFMISNKRGEKIFSINDSGDVFLAGNVFEGIENLSFKQDSFIVENSLGNIVAILNSSGDLKLTGFLDENAEIISVNESLEFRDRDSVLRGLFDSAGNFRIMGKLEENVYEIYEGEIK